MAHIYRAFYAPMNRMNAPSGIPTKVPFLFANIVRRLLKDYQPEYVAIVFDTRQPTFRDCRTYGGCAKRCGCRFWSWTGMRRTT